MDEVDGCGAGDRGGVAALTQIIKQTKTPIICICNDGQDRKLQTLVTYCYHLKFMPPQVKDVEKRIKMIIQNEKLQIDDQTLGRLISSTGGADVRQIINLL